MFDFFKKNQPQPLEPAAGKNATVAAAPGPAVASQPAVNEPVKDNLVIHVMPEKFRHQPVKQNSAKTTGLLIIIGGAVFLLVAAVAMYYFLFKQPEVTVNEEPSALTEDNQAEAPGQTAAEPNALNQPAGTGETEEVLLPLGGQSAATTTASTTPETAPADTGLNLSLGQDSDNDGLTDLEEIILSTSSAAPDSDGDGYMDGSEVMNLYNPAGAGKITANGNIATYENKTFAYDLLYPAAWQTSVNGGDDSLMFKSADNQFVQVIVQPNVTKQTLDQWYMEQLGVLAISPTDRVAGLNWQGLKSPDGLNIYLMDKKQNYIYNLTYNPGGSNILEYSNIFQLMLKSFNLKD